MVSDSNSRLQSSRSKTRNHNRKTSQRVKTFYLIYTRINQDSNICLPYIIILSYLFNFVKLQCSRFWTSVVVISNEIKGDKGLAQVTAYYNHRRNKELILE